VFSFLVGLKVDAECIALNLLSSLDILTNLFVEK
jgi:hypothetical protein